MTSALKEIVDRTEYNARVEHERTCDAGPFEECERCDPDRSLISRARAEMERGVNVVRLIEAVAVPLEVIAASDADWTIADISPTLRDALRSAVAACREAASTIAGVRVVEDGKDS